MSGEDGNLQQAAATLRMEIANALHAMGMPATEDEFRREMLTAAIHILSESDTGGSEDDNNEEDDS